MFPIIYLWWLTANKLLLETSCFSIFGVALFALAMRVADAGYTSVVFSTLPVSMPVSLVVFTTVHFIFNMASTMAV